MIIIFEHWNIKAYKIQDISKTVHRETVTNFASKWKIWKKNKRKLMTYDLKIKKQE